MRVFVTGASGWIGSATVDELLAAGHRSRARPFRRVGRGVGGAGGHRAARRPRRPRRPAQGAADADAVVHLANKHDWANPAASNAAERGAVEAIAETLVGTERPFVLASGVAGLAQGRPSTEEDPSPFHGPDSPRGGSENLALELRRPRRARGERPLRADRARRARPRVHRRTSSAWPARRASRRTSATAPTAGRPCTGRRRPAGPARPRAGARGHPPARRRRGGRADEGDRRGHRPGPGPAGRPPIAPEDAVEHFGFIGAFFAMDLSASSERTRELFGWEPTGPTLVEDIEAGAYFPS